MERYWNLTPTMDQISTFWIGLHSILQFPIDFVEVCWRMVRMGGHNAQWDYS